MLFFFFFAFSSRINRVREQTAAPCKAGGAGASVLDGAEMVGRVGRWPRPALDDSVAFNEPNATGLAPSVVFVRLRFYMTPRAGCKRRAV